MIEVGFPAREQGGEKVVLMSGEGRSITLQRNNGSHSLIKYQNPHIKPILHFVSTFPGCSEMQYKDAHYSRGNPKHQQARLEIGDVFEILLLSQCIRKVYHRYYLTEKGLKMVMPL